MVRFEPDGTGLVAGEWSTGAVDSVAVGTRVALDGPTVAARIRDTGLPARVDSYADVGGSTAELLRELGYRSGVGAPVKLAGRVWGAVMVSTVEDKTFPAGSEQRLADFAELVALALANAEARRELAASRARIVATGDAERRRLERNLHDGAQQRLVSLALTLRMCEVKLAGDDPALLELIGRARAELGEALDELRELARGIHPAILTDQGLAPALAVLARRASVPVELSVELDERLPEPVEAAAYYIVAEALTNAAKHAGAECVRVAVRRAADEALVEVGDDGCGGADAGGGSGLRGLRDRVEALGGELELESPVGGGTTLIARLPLRRTV
jgi:signal transduction histidine kinase